jgi:hypothetical protein
VFRDAAQFYHAKNTKEQGCFQSKIPALCGNAGQKRTEIQQCKQPVTIVQGFLISDSSEKNMAFHKCIEVATKINFKTFKNVFHMLPYTNSI